MVYVIFLLFYYSKLVVVFVGYWIGSMGEGMVIGFDVIGVKVVIGIFMVDLFGGIN